MQEKPMVNYLDTLTAVFGYPVSENPTVVMMEAAFKATGLRWKYLTIEVRPDDLKKAVKGARAMGFKGFNLTIPHKTAVVQYLDEITPAAKLIGAVNTVHHTEGRLVGDNTDGKGFIKALEEGNIEVRGKNIQVLGAGGAARAISVELALAGASNVYIVNRNAEKGLDLSNHIGYNTAAQAVFVPWSEKMNIEEDVDILVNATSIGLYPDVSQPGINWSSLANGTIVCDVIPNPPRTGFLGSAEAHGARTIDGLGMLVYQGAIGFKMWTGYEAPVFEMKQALEGTFGKT